MVDALSHGCTVQHITCEHCSSAHLDEDAHATKKLTMHVWEKVVALWPVGVGQSLSAILVAVGWWSFVARSAVACYAVGCHSIAACMLLETNCR